MILLELFLVFLKIGLFTVGGGYAMIPMISAETEKMGWITFEELVGFLAVSESTPGPFAVNVATYIGSETAGLAGAVCATVGVVLPSFIIVLLASAFYARYRHNIILTSCMSGLRAAVAGLIGAAALSVAGTVFPQRNFEMLSFAGCALILVFMFFLLYKKAGAAVIIPVSALCGIILGFMGI
ncbi:MAG: chromate transporter [Eubacteriales bacterium]|nr:chromate transporter [Eubacteriales bacterium]